MFGIIGRRGLTGCRVTRSSLNSVRISLRASSSNNISADSQPLAFPFPFPWRSLPVTLSDSWLERLRLKFVYMISSHLKEEEFIEGAKVAFRYSRDTIIKYVQQKQLPSNDTQKQEEEAPIILADTLSPILARFYEKWISNFLENYPNAEVYYRLVDEEKLSAKIKKTFVQAFQGPTMELLQSSHPVIYEQLKNKDPALVADSNAHASLDGMMVRLDVAINCRGISAFFFLSLLAQD